MPNELIPFLIQLCYAANRVLELDDQLGIDEVDEYELRVARDILRDRLLRVERELGIHA